MAFGRRRGGTNDTMASVEVFSMSNVSIAFLTAQVNVCAFSAPPQSNLWVGVRTALMAPTHFSFLVPCSINLPSPEPRISDLNAMRKSDGRCRLVPIPHYLTFRQICICRNASHLRSLTALVLERSIGNLRSTASSSASAVCPGLPLSSTANPRGWVLLSQKWLLPESRPMTFCAARPYCSYTICLSA